MITLPLPRFARSVDFAGVNVRPGADGLTREWRNVWTIGGERIASVIDPGRSLPGERSVPIDFSISPASFTYVSYFDVLENRVPPEVFTGKSVFVGATALELGDMLAVPVYGRLPGIVVQAMAAETVTAGAPLLAPRWVSAALLAGWTLLATSLFTSSWRRNLAVLLVAFAFMVALSVFAFAAHRLVIGSAAPMLVVALLFVAMTVRWLDVQTWRAFAYAVG